MRKTALILVLFAVFIAPMMQAFAQERPNIPDLLENDKDGRFTTLLSALDAAGLRGLLVSDGPYTLLAPTNDAFDATLGDLGLTVDDLTANPRLLKQVLLYHIIPGSYLFRNLTSGPTLPTALVGKSVTFDLTSGVFTVEGANIGDVDNLASNGVVQVIDSVILPPGAADALTPTMEATPEPTAEPTEAATPAPTPEATAVAGVPAARPDLLTLLQDDPDGRFTTLLAAIDAAGLTGTLEGNGPYTLLAPTNDAFDATLGDLGLTVDDLTANPRVLKQILLYHIIPGSYLFRNLTSGPTLPTTLVGKSVTFDLTSGVFTVEGANISDPDNLASNGVMIAIDSVMLPPGVADALAPTMEATPEATAAPTETATSEPTAVAGVPAARPDLLTLLQDDPDGRFTTLLAAIDAAGITGTLEGNGPYTLLAPTNDAFDATLGDLGLTVDDLTANPQLLKQILLYHIVPGSYLFRDLTSGPTLPTTLVGQSVTFDLSGGNFTVEGAHISDPDNLASNGVMLAIDSVLVPPSAQAMLATPEPTVEPPMATPEVTEMTTPTPEPTPEATAVAGVPAERPNLIELLQDDPDGQFTTLLAALKASGLDKTLSSGGPYTLLAPTNDAFTAALETLGMSPQQVMANPSVLTQILQYHVIPGEYFFRNLTSGPTLPTLLQGESVTFDLTSGVFTVEGANIGDTDNLASNGIVHVIDSVMIPPSLQAMLATPEPTETPTEEPTATPTPEATSEAPTSSDTAAAHWRVAQFAVDGDGLDLYIDGAVSDMTNVSFASVSDWMGVEAGTYEIGIAPTGEDPTATVSVDVAEGDWVTIAVTGASSAGTLTATPIYETTTPLVEGAARLSVFNGVEGSRSYDVLVDGTAQVIQLGYPGTQGANDGYYSVDLTAATYHIQFVINGQRGTVVVDLPSVTLDAGKETFIAAIGTAGAPGVKIVTTDAP